MNIEITVVLGKRRVGTGGKLATIYVEAIE